MLKNLAANNETMVYSFDTFLCSAQISNIFSSPLHILLNQTLNTDIQIFELHIRVFIFRSCLHLFLFFPKLPCVTDRIRCDCFIVQ